MIIVYIYIIEIPYSLRVTKDVSETFQQSSPALSPTECSRNCFYLQCYCTMWRQENCIIFLWAQNEWIPLLHQAALSTNIRPVSRNNTYPETKLRYVVSGHARRGRSRSSSVLVSRRNPVFRGPPLLPMFNLYPDLHWRLSGQSSCMQIGMPTREGRMRPDYATIRLLLARPDGLWALSRVRRCSKNVHGLQGRSDDQRRSGTTRTVFMPIIWIEPTDCIVNISSMMHL